ncbi:MAG: zinc-binding dehydrogenase [Bacteroidota bacterium]|nr:zinc-binding dehydrogenase [Bacteroidota bacterium]
MVLKTMRPGPIFCIEPLEYRRVKALKSGANYSIHPFETDPFESIREMEPQLLDIVFECSGQQKAVDDATKVLKPGRKLVLIGIPPEGKYVFDMDLMRRKEISIQNIRRQNHCIEKAIKLIESGLQVDLMVTHHFQPEKTQQAFEIVANYQDSAIKAMIDF